MHSLEELLTVLEQAPLSPSPEYTYRVIAERWRDSPLSAIGAFERGGRYNAPRTFPVLYSADSPVTALQEVEALFETLDGRLQGVPRDPEIVLTVECRITRVLDLTKPELLPPLGTSREELISAHPSRFILNARNEQSPTQQLGLACSRSQRISALKVPSTRNALGYYFDIFLDSLAEGEHILILDSTGRLKAEVRG